MDKTYEIEARYRDWEQKIMEAEGELTPELQAEFEGLTEDMNKKLEILAKLYKERKDAESAKKAAEESIAKRRKSDVTAMNGLRRLMDSLMGTFSLRKFETPEISVYYRKSRSLVIDDESKIPEEYWKVERSPMRAALKEAVDAGQAVAGCHIEEKQNLQVQ